MLSLMLIDLRDIHSLSDFQRNAKQYIARLQESHKPVVLTVNGEAALIVQDAASYQAMLEELEIARSAALIQQRQETFAQDGIDLDAREALQSLKEG